MRRYFAKSCPRCGNDVRITMRKPQKNAPVQAVDGRCAACSYRLAWLVLKGNKPGLLKTSFVPSPSP
jgi:hypothetical protein